MTEHDLERALRDWAQADADVTEPARLRERVMAVPESAEAQASFPTPLWTRWRPQPLAVSAIAAAVLVLLVVSLVPLFMLSPDEEDTETGATIVVALDGTGDFETIADAVAAASDGDTILVRPGTYEESVLIDKDITLRGDGDRDEIVITSPSERPGRFLPRDEQPYAIRLDDADATVGNMTLSGPASALIVLGGSPRITNVAIIDVGIATRGESIGAESGRFVGLALAAGSTATVRDSYFLRSDVIAHDEADVTLEANELEAAMIQVGQCCLLDRDPTAVPDSARIVIRGNSSRRAWNAIWIGEGGIAQIEENDIVAAEDAAITMLRLRPGSSILGNAVRDSETAILVSSGPADVLENELSGNQVGLNVSGSGFSVRGNRIHDNIVGVLVNAVTGATTSPSLEGNTIEGNVRGIAISASASPSLTGNVVCDNETNLVIVEGADPTFEDNRICADVASAAAP